MKYRRIIYIYIFLIVCFTSYFVFSIAVLPHSPGVPSIVIVRAEVMDTVGYGLKNSNLKK